jgi:hypothetical protein
MLAAVAVIYLIISSRRSLIIWSNLARATGMIDVHPP